MGFQLRIVKALKIAVDCCCDWIQGPSDAAAKFKKKKKSCGVSCQLSKAFLQLFHPCAWFWGVTRSGPRSPVNKFNLSDSTARQALLNCTSNASDCYVCLVILPSVLLTSTLSSGTVKIRVDLPSVFAGYRFYTAAQLKYSSCIWFWRQCYYPGILWSRVSSFQLGCWLHKWSPRYSK